MGRTRLLGIALASSLAVSACTGTIGGGGDAKTTTGPTDPADQAVASLETTRFPRLSHLQWENTVQDLFYLSAPTGLSMSFGGDPLGGVFDNNEAVLIVSSTHWADYQVAAEEVSLLVVSDAAILQSILPPNEPTDPEARARAFVEHFGQRVYRRPLIEDEITAYLDLFLQAQTVLEGNDNFVKGVQLSIQAFLQSPHFLYRVEGSSEVGEDGLIHLTSYEVASKLSYLLWATMPDQQLFDAASAGALETSEGIMTQAQRLLADDRAKGTVKTMHAQLYQFDHYDDLYKDPALFPTFPTDFGDDLKQEAEMFIDDVAFSGGGLYELLTAPFSYVNADLAAIYGLQGNFDENFVKVDLDPAQRSGFLTRVGFLASNGTPREQNTIHRGVFINLRVLCVDLPSPPDNVDGLPPAGDFNTNRERVEGHTGPGTCAETCHHTLINPPGYALENFNAIGEYQTDENGYPVDATGEYRLDGETVTFDGGIAFSELIASSEAAHHCYAKHWLQFGYGRVPQEGDEGNIDELMQTSLSGSVQDLILALTQTKAFRTRGILSEEEGQ
jgi:hypothetical protein